MRSFTTRAGLGLLTTGVIASAVITAGPADATAGAAPQWHVTVISPGVNPSSTLTAVACPTSTWCAAAVGSYYLKRGQLQPMSVTESGGRWHRAVGMELPAHTTPGPYGLDSIACTHAGSCVAVGSYTAEDGFSTAAAARQVNGRWLRVAPLKLPAGAGPASQLNSASCQPSGQCVAVGTFDRPAGQWSGHSRTNQLTPRR